MMIDNHVVLQDRIEKFQLCNMLREVMLQIQALPPDDLTESILCLPIESKRSLLALSDYVNSLNVSHTEEERPRVANYGQPLPDSDDDMELGRSLGSLGSQIYTSKDGMIMYGMKRKRSSPPATQTSSPAKTLIRGSGGISEKAVHVPVRKATEESQGTASAIPLPREITTEVCSLCNKPAEGDQIVACDSCLSWFHCDCCKFTLPLPPAVNVTVYTCDSCVSGTSVNFSESIHGIEENIGESNLGCPNLESLMVENFVSDVNSLRDEEVVRVEVDLPASVSTEEGKVIGKKGKKEEKATTWRQV